MQDFQLNKIPKHRQKIEEYLTKYTNNTWLKSKLDEIITQDSKYAQFYKPRNLAEVLQKIKLAKVTGQNLTENDLFLSKSKNISKTLNANSKGIRNMIFGEDTKTENFPEKYILPESYSAVDDMEVSELLSVSNENVLAYFSEKNFYAKVFFSKKKIFLQKKYPQKICHILPPKHAKIRPKTTKCHPKH